MSGVSGRFTPRVGGSDWSDTTGTRKGSRAREGRNQTAGRVSGGSATRAFRSRTTSSTPFHPSTTGKI
eukprot:749821-Hanusia_phi.AAC.4